MYSQIPETKKLLSILYFFIFFFLLTFCTRNFFQWEGKLTNTGNIYKVLQEKNCISNISYLILNYLSSYLTFLPEGTIFIGIKKPRLFFK